MKRLTIDSSVIIASLLTKEPRHREAFEIWQTVLAGENLAILPYSILVETTSAIRRRTGSEELALHVKEELLTLATVSFVILDERSANEAAELAAKTAVRGMDALVVQVAKEYGAELVSFDDDMIKKVRPVLTS
jgi:predicted nucleic acid-binding protein